MRKPLACNPVRSRCSRTWACCGAILDAAVDFHGQLVYVNGVRAGEIALSLPDDVPFGFVCIPQYETERILRDELAALGVAVAARRRGWRDSTRTPTG